MTYLTDSPVATLQQVLVECKDPYCRYFYFDFIEYSEGCVYIVAEKVPMDKLNDVIPKYISSLFFVKL